MNTFRKKTWKVLSMLLAFALVLTIFPIAFSKVGYYASAENNTTTRRLGCWWWHTADSDNATTRQKYLKFLHDHNVTEIYFYGYSMLPSSSGRKSIHTFVSEANALGMRVSILYEYAGGVMNGASSTLNGLKSNYNSYKSEYPNDNLYGFHFDIEPDQSESNFTRYVNNFIKYLYILRDNGCEVEVDVGCGWGSYGTNITLDGVKGLYNIIASKVDTMTLMSYRDTARGIYNMGYEALQCCMEQNCDVLFGVETDNANEGDQVDFSNESVQYLEEQMTKFYQIMDGKNITVNYGMAIHHARSFNNLRLLQPTTVAMKLVSLYKVRDLNLTLPSGSHSYVYTTPELVEALHNDYQQFGKVDDTGSYYRITVSVKSSTSNNYLYPCLWDSTGQYDIWPTGGLSDYPYGTTVGTTLKNVGSYIRSLYYKKASTYATLSGEEDGIYLYWDNSATITLDAVTVEIYHPASIMPTDSDVSDISDVSDVSDVSDISDVSVNSDVSTEPISDISTTSITPAVVGDANGDLVVDLKDVLSIRKHVANMEQDFFDEMMADVNIDGNIDMKDILEIRKYIANMPSILDNYNV